MKFLVLSLCLFGMLASQPARAAHDPDFDFSDNSFYGGLELNRFFVELVFMLETETITDSTGPEAPVSIASFNVASFDPAGEAIDSLTFDDSDGIVASEKAVLYVDGQDLILTFESLEDGNFAFAQPDQDFDGLLFRPGSVLATLLDVSEGIDEQATVSQTNSVVLGSRIPAPIPAPAAGWLFFSGLAFLAQRLRSRRRPTITRSGTTTPKPEKVRPRQTLLGSARTSDYRALC